MLVSVAKASGGDGDLSTADHVADVHRRQLERGPDRDRRRGGGRRHDQRHRVVHRLVDRPDDARRSAATEADNDTPSRRRGPVTLRAAADTYVRGGTTLRRHELRHDRDDAREARLVGRQHAEAYLRFDLASVAASVGSAKLRLFGKLDNTTNASVGITVYSASEHDAGPRPAITGTTSPPAGTTGAGRGTVTGTTAKWYELDLTELPQAAEKAAGAHGRHARAQGDGGEHRRRSSSTATRRRPATAAARRDARRPAAAGAGRLGDERERARGRQRVVHREAGGAAGGRRRRDGRQGDAAATGT